MADYVLTDADVKTLMKMKADIESVNSYLANLKSSGFTPKSGDYGRGNHGESLAGVQVQRVKIIADASGGGKYDGRMVFNSCTSSSASGNLSMPEGQLVSTTDDCLVFNIAESGSSGHLLTANSYHIGIQCGVNSSTGRKVVLINSYGASMIPVKCTQTGGSAGSSSTTCSFTYTVKSLSGTSLGTSQTPTRPRIANIAYNTPSADAYGQAFYDGTTLVLVEVFTESPTSGAGCS